MTPKEQALQALSNLQNDAINIYNDRSSTQKTLSVWTQRVMETIKIYIGEDSTFYKSMKHHYTYGYGDIRKETKDIIDGLIAHINSNGTKLDTTPVKEVEKIIEKPIYIKENWFSNWHTWQVLSLMLAILSCGFYFGTQKIEYDKTQLQSKITGLQKTNDSIIKTKENIKPNILYKDTCISKQPKIAYLGKQSHEDSYNVDAPDNKGAIAVGPNSHAEVRNYNDSAMKEYYHYAVMNIYGTDVMPGFGMSLESDLYKKMKKVLVEKDNIVYCTNDLKTLPLIEEIIREYPKFPFGYWVKYNLLKGHNDNSWRVPAKKALDIFKITTTIEGHDESQDEAMKHLISDLSK